MLEIARIALLRPHPEEIELLKRALSGEYFSVRQVERPDQILALIEEEDSSFDAIVLPPKCFDLDGGLTFCSQVRSVSELNSIPIISLIQEPEDRFIQCLYDSGVNAICYAPFNPITIRSLIASNRNFKNSVFSDGKFATQKSSLSDTSLSILNALDCGVAVLNENGSITFLNQPLLGILKTAEVTERVLESLTSQILESFPQIQREDLGKSNHPVIVRRSITRGDGDRTPATLKIERIVNSEGRFLGWACFLSEDSHIDNLAELIKHTSALRTSFISKAVENIATASSSNLNMIAGDVIEALDNIIPEHLSLSLDKLPNSEINLPSDTIFRILANSICAAADFLFWRGTINISAPVVASQGFAKLRILAQREGFGLSDKSDKIASLLRSPGIKLSGDSKPIIKAIEKLLPAESVTPITVEERDNGIEINIIMSTR